MEKWKNGDDHAGEKANKAAILVTLAQQAQHGDREALIALCQSIVRGVYFRISCLLHNNVEAEDVSQEVLIRVCTKIHELNDPKLFNAWLNRIILNETNRYLGKNAKHAAILDINDYLNTMEEENTDFLPQEYVFKQDDRNAVMEAIKQLPEQQRRVVIMHYYDGLRVTEIADVMDLSKTSVSKYLKLAQNKLKNNLQAQGRQIGSLGDAGYASLGMLLTQIQLEDIQINDAWAQRATDTCVEHIKLYDRKDSSAIPKKEPVGWILPSVAAAFVVAALAWGLWGGGAFRQAPSIMPDQSAAVEGEIIFLTSDETASDINPTQASAWAVKENSELTAQSWWITSSNSDTVLYSGEGGVVDTVLLQMQECGADGRYIIHVIMEDASGSQYRFSREFMIETSAEPRADDLSEYPVG